MPAVRCLGINFHVTENFGAGIHYNDFELDVVIDKSDWRGRADMSFEGIYAYVSAYW